MSQWTHIRGGFEIDGTPLDSKKEKKYYKDGDKSVYLPFPEQQLSISEPVSIKGLDSEDLIRFEVQLFSLPRIRKYIEEASELLPQGETGYCLAINQDSSKHYYSSGQLDYPCLKKEFEKQLKSKYGSDIFKKKKVSVLDVKYVSNVVIGIREDIRWCSAKEMTEGLVSFFTYLRDHDIIIEDGYLEWEDEFDGKYIYAWRKSRIHFDEKLWSFYVLDAKTNAIIKETVYKLPFKEIKLKNGNVINGVDYDSKEYIIEEIDRTNCMKKD